jgi:serine/threonine-protein kinase ATR
VSDLLAELDSVNDTALSWDASLPAALPSSASLNEFWSESQSFVALPHDLQRTIDTPLGAIHISFNLLLALLPASKPSEIKDTGFGTLQHLQTWTLDSCSILWRFFCRWTTETNRPLLADNIVGLYLQVLEAVSRSLTNPNNHFSNPIKTALALADGLCRLLEDISTSPLSDVNQVPFATILVRLRGAVVSVPGNADASSRRRSIPESIIHDILEPSVVRICHHVEMFTALQKDLQVCTYLSN